jgi:hypothetical protein
MDTRDFSVRDGRQDAEGVMLAMLALCASHAVPDRRNPGKEGEWPILA